MRRPYSQLLAGLPAAEASLPVAAEQEAPAGRGSPATALSSDAERQYRAEVRTLTAMVDREYLSAGAEGKKMCAFVREKLAASAEALDRGDGDGCWFQLFGAATLCVSFPGQAEQSRRAVARLNSMLW
jgi:hypothetical protein